MSGIPCLSYKRAIEEEKRLSEISQSMPDQSSLNSGEVTCPASNNCEEQVAPMEQSPEDDSVDLTDGHDHQPKKRKLDVPFTNAKIETVNENLKEQSLTDNQVIDYCKSLFIFKSIRVMRFE